MKRPFGISLLAFIMVIPAVANGLRLSEAIFFWRTLAKYGSSPIYICITGGFWLVIALILFQGLWFGKTWAWLGTLGGVCGYEAWYWIDRILLQIPHANWIFALGITIFILSVSALILLNKYTRAYYNWLKLEAIRQHHSNSYPGEDNGHSGEY